MADQEVRPMAKKIILPSLSDVAAVNLSKPI